MHILNYLQQQISAQVVCVWFPLAPQQYFVSQLSLWFYCWLVRTSHRLISRSIWLKVPCKSIMLCAILVDSACVRILWKLRQQRGMKMVLAYVTDVLVKMNNPEQHVKNEVHALLIRQDHRVCELRKHFSFLFTPFFEDFSAAQPFLLQQVNNQLVHDFLSQQNNRLFLFLSELMDLFVAGRDQSAADQPNYLAEGHPPL